MLNGTLFLFNTHNGMSGTSLYDSAMLIGFAFYTFAPVVIVGWLDQPASASTAYALPEAYTHGQTNSAFSLRVVLAWILNATLHAAIIYYVTLNIWGRTGGEGPEERVSGSSGHPGQLLELGTALHLMVVLTVNAKLAIEMRMHSPVQLAALASCVFLWFAVELAWNAAQPWLTEMGFNDGEPSLAETETRPKHWPR